MLRVAVEVLVAVAEADDTIVVIGVEAKVVNCDFVGIKSGEATAKRSERVEVAVGVEEDVPDAVAVAVLDAVGLAVEEPLAVALADALCDIEELGDAAAEPEAAALTAPPNRDGEVDGEAAAERVEVAVGVEEDVPDAVAVAVLDAVGLAVEEPLAVALADTLCDIEELGDAAAEPEAAALTAPDRDGAVDGEAAAERVEVAVGVEEDVPDAVADAVLDDVGVPVADGADECVGTPSPRKTQPFGPHTKFGAHLSTTAPTAEMGVQRGASAPPPSGANKKPGAQARLNNFVVGAQADTASCAGGSANVGRHSSRVRLTSTPKLSKASSCRRGSDGKVRARGVSAAASDNDNNNDNAVIAAEAARRGTRAKAIARPYSCAQKRLRRKRGGAAARDAASRHTGTSSALDGYQLFEVRTFLHSPVPSSEYAVVSLIIN